MIDKTIRLYFGLSSRVASSIVGYLVEHQSEVSEIIEAANSAAKVFSEESASYQEHCKSLSKILNSTFVEGIEE